MPATIKSIAAEAGISYQAVSAVLNGKTNCRVSPQRREQILAIAKAQGYHTNFGYKLMRGQSTHTVAIISAMRQIESDSHVRKLLLTLMQRLNLQGYSTYFNNTMTSDADKNIRQIRELINRGAEHFIFIGSPIGHEDIQQELLDNRRTYIGWNSFFDRDLNTDSRRASIEIFRFLYRISGELPQVLIAGSNDVRLDALRQVIRESGTENTDISNYVTYIPSPAWEERDFTTRAVDSGYQWTETIFARKNPPVSIAYYTDTYALGGVLWCQKHNILVGRDVFISGFNNIDAVRFHPMPITSAAHPVDESIDILLREMSSNAPFRQTLELEVFLRKNSNTQQPNTKGFMP